MTTETKKTESIQFGLTLIQKILYGVLLFGAAFAVTLLSPLFAGPGGTVFFVFYGILVGVLSWFVSSGWVFSLELTPREIRVRDAGRIVAIPLEKVGMVVRGGRSPFLPAVWLVLRGVDIGRELPAKGVNPVTQEMLTHFQRRNPGKKITFVPIPIIYLRSAGEFVGELKRRIPPLTVDERLGRK
ncbi:hypothetical protein [Symbiobacterium thermophilum]|uniref:Uncharacterized protein n=1 Tax=Symbiobacterium thermophilum (strain DSM 24528 / JCM 14929 / IAM 14863 / T) TaxID=292459 RepID=Q67P91_SYMTH|nr:hypothetical protein [Symbiobacterium thermophilum]BAD40502.1 hypothetical protein STH1517 [Symbiobacterium thermophilum IAM 14863]